MSEGISIEIPGALLAVLNGKDVSVDTYLQLDESVLLYAFHQWSRSDDTILADLADRFLTRRLFAPIVRDEPSVSEWASLRTMAKAMGFPPDYYVTERVSTIPGYEVLGQGLTLLDDFDGYSDLSQVSKLIRTLVPSQEHRLFLPKEMLESDNESLSKRVHSIVFLRP